MLEQWHLMTVFSLPLLLCLGRNLSALSCGTKSSSVGPRSGRSFLASRISSSLRGLSNDVSSHSRTRSFTSSLVTSSLCCKAGVSKSPSALISSHYLCTNVTLCLLSRHRVYRASQIVRAIQTEFLQSN